MSQTPITITYSLEEVLKRFEQKLDNFDTKFSAKIEDLDTKLTGKIEAFDAKFTSKIEDLDTKLTGKIEALDAKFTSEIEDLDTKLTGKIEALDAKFTGTIDPLQKEVNGMNIRLTKVENKLDTEVETMKNDIKEIKGSQKAQIWTLIGILITVVGGFVVAVGRLVFFGNF